MAFVSPHPGTHDLITHLANCPSRSLPTNSSDESHFQASSFTALSACPTHVSTMPCAFDSASRPSSASIRTFPASSFVLHVPHCPRRQDERYANSMLLSS